jgi:TolB-like protein/DNA-binding winged helix-turn-helix (wHTH) protein/Tfp pilus assembly protein PilF
MEEATPLQPVVRFGEYQLDTRAGDLHKGDVTLRLHKQPLQVLLLLLEHQGELVTREELRTALWPDHTFVDFEDSLNHAIRRLREALGDSAENPRFIETLPRRGYRFIHPVDPGVGLAVPKPVQPKGPLGKYWQIALGAGAIVAALSLGFVFNVLGLRSRLLTANPASSLAGPLRIESIAVLPFENLSGDPAQEYFADGMTEELVTNLGKISTLRVISRTSVMLYKGSKKPLPEIARELNVDAIVEGTVQRSGNHVRVTANLLYAPTDRHLWAESYESELGDVLILQGKVARSIADEIGIKLMSQEKTRLASTRSVNPDAYEAYLKAKYYASKWSEEGFKKSVASFRQAIDIDPAYAPAYGGLGEVYCLMGLWALKPSTEIYPLAKAAALKALELDDGLAEAHADLGLVKFQYDWDWSGGEQELKRAVTLNPSSSSAHLFYGLFLTVMGRADESVKETRIALELDPLTPSTNVQLGWVLYYARRHDESIAQLKKALELAPDFGYANMEIGWNYAQKGMNQEAATECQRAVSLASEDQVTLASCGDVYGMAGRHQDALALLDRLKRLSTQGYVDPYNFACLYDGLGENQPTMEWLERAYRARSASLPALRVEVWSGRLRSDRRFQELVQRMNFPK